MESLRLLEGVLLGRLNTVQLHPKDADRGAETTVRDPSAKRLDTVHLGTPDPLDPLLPEEGRLSNHPDDTGARMLSFAKEGCLTRLRHPAPLVWPEWVRHLLLPSKG